MSLPQNQLNLSNKSFSKPEDFCEAILSKMTLEEKIGQMVQANLTWKQDIPELLRAGQIGSLLSIKDTHVINQLQQIAVEESRLGIPLLVGNDVIHGYRTTFPIPLGMASSWNLELIEQVATDMVREAAAAGTSWTFAPMVDICRDPRWGRIAEGAGEDPYLGSEISRAWVTGIQSYITPSGRKIAACVKHFAGYGAAESGKDYNTVDMSERRLRDIYLLPYHAAVEAGVMSIMTSFNELNGIPATANTFLLQQILRKEWGFDGVIISDFDAIGELIFHGIARDHKEAALKSIQAGVDIDMMGDAYHFHLADLIHEGSVSESIIDASVRRILMLKLQLGLFENPYVDETATQASFLQSESLDLATKAAEETIVLLKNENDLLPIRPEHKKIALIGPFVEERQSLLGCWAFDGQKKDVETLRESFERNFPTGTHFLYDKGCEINGDETDFSMAVQTAQAADVVILALGEAETMSGEAHSRAYLGLPGQQQALSEAVRATGKPVIALLYAGRPLAIPWLAQNIPALLMAWHGGTQTAQAVSNILLGKANPSAKITASFPYCEGQIPVYYSHKRTGRPYDSSGTLQFNEAHKSIYLDETNLPLYPFGFGLSYTEFSYQDMVVQTPVIETNGTLTVTINVTNIGTRPGKEIVQCYIRDVFGSITRPVKELKGFKKVLLEPGESQDVRFDIPTNRLSFHGPEMKPVVEPGDFIVWIGPNSAEGIQSTFKIV